MPYPSSVNTRFVSVGIPREAIGWREVNADVTLNPLFSTALDLTSGGLVRGVPQKVELRAENGWQQTVQVLAGEQEHLSITNFDLQISYTFYDGLPAPDPFRVRIPKWTGVVGAAPVIDLDLVLPVTSPGSPLTNVPFVTPDQLELRLAGLGSGGSGAPSDASVEALVKDPVSKTRGAIDVLTGTKLDLSAVRISADDPGVLELDIMTSAPVVTVPVDPEPVPPVVVNPGGAIDALMPHPYYTPRSYTALIGGVSTVIADPYQPYAGDRPPSKNGLPIGRLAAPSLYGYPDETNTGIPAGVVLKPLSGEIKVEDKGVTVGAVLTARPAAGAAPVTVGPVTLYPVAEPLTHADAPMPVHTVFDGAMTDNTILRYGNTSILARRSLLRGNGRRSGVMENYGYGMFFATDSRLDGGYNAEASIGEGGRYYLQRCNITGGADVIQPRSVGCYLDFCYLHGTRIVETRHNDSLQIATSHLEASLAALFGGWNIRVRRCTAFSYGQKVGAQWLQFGDITGDVRNVLVQDMLGFGGQYMYGFGFGKYYNGYGLNADGTPITKVSGLTGVAETHPWVRNVFLDGHTLGRKAVDGFPGGGGTTLAVPRYGLTASKRSSAHFVGGLYGDPPPVSMRTIRWDDTNETAFADIGRTDWAAAATAEGLDFTRYTTGA